MLHWFSRDETLVSRVEKLVSRYESLVSSGVTCNLLLSGTLSLDCIFCHGAKRKASPMHSNYFTWKLILNI